MCLPKDTSNLVNVIKKNNLKFKLIESIHKDNQFLKKQYLKKMKVINSLFDLLDCYMNIFRRNIFNFFLLYLITFYLRILNFYFINI